MSRPSSGSVESDKSETSRSSNYIKYDLFEDVELTSSKHVKIIEGEEKISNNPELRRRILELRNQELARVKSDKNKILATIICYRKDNFTESFKEIPITLPAEMFEGYSEDGRPNYTDEVREDIFRVEKDAVLSGLRRRNEKINKLKEDNQRQFFPLERIRLEIESEMLELKTLNLKIKDVTEEGFEDESLKDIKKSLADRGMKLSEEGEKSLSELKKIFQDFFGQKMADLSTRKRELLSEGLTEQKAKDLLFEVELKKIKKLLDDPTLLESSVREQRGHREDYLHYAMRQDYLMKPLIEQVPVGSDRFYLMIFSTMDACKRCSSKVEEMAQITAGAFNPENNSEVKSKVLYFAREQMRDRSGSGDASEYGDRITDDNLSSSAKAALHFEPVVGCASAKEATKDKFFVSKNLKPKTSVEAESAKSLSGGHDRGDGGVVGGGSGGGGGGGGGGEISSGGADFRRQASGVSGDELQKIVFEVGRNHGYENKMRDWFLALYQILLGQDPGLRMGSFIALFGIENFVKLVEEKIS